MATRIIRFPRAPSEELRELLKPGEFLAPVIALNRAKFKGTELDVHFRTNDKIQLYCGLTTILSVQKLHRPARHLRVDADPSYKGQPGAKATGLFRRWKIGDGGFIKAFEAYLDGVDVNQRFTEGEGEVQSRWSGVSELWVPFDREAVLTYESTEHREETKTFPEVEAALESIQATARRQGWKEPESVAKARKVDQIAVDLKGRLVLIELKDAKTNDYKVFYAPFQLLQYLWEWHCALEEVRADLQELIDARLSVGLTPAGIARPTGGLRAVVGFGTDNRTDEVRHRYGMVLDIANRHLPPHVAPIETWEHTRNEPRPVVGRPGVALEK